MKFVVCSTGNESLEAIRDERRGGLEGMRRFPVCPVPLTKGRRLCSNR